MSLLTDAPKDYVIVDNREIPICTDFRNWIRIDSILNDRSYPAEKKAAEILSLCFKRLPDNIGQAFEAAAKFYNPYPARGQGGQKRRVYSFEHDAPYIYAAFLSEYGIDLHKVSMHWHTFLALFMSLGSECVFSRIIAVREADISEMTGRRRTLYKRLKHAYMLPGEAENEESVAAELAGFF